MTSPASAPTRVVLLALDWIRPKDPRMSLGHASILARLAAEPGVEVTPLARAVNAPGFDARALRDAVLAALVEADVLAVGVYVWNEPVVQRLLPELRRAGFRGAILLGGPQITYAPPGVLALYPAADAAIRGPGEDALAAWLRDPTAAVPGLFRRGEPDLGAQARADFATLPSPILTGVLPVQPFMRWETQRGCIYACSFCQHRAASGRRPAVLPSARVLAEIEALVAGGATDIAVLDPIFHTNPSAIPILRRFAELGYRGRLSLQSRFEQVDEAFLDACAPLDVRLEFGLQTVHTAEMRAIRRMNDSATSERVIGELRARGIAFEVSLIYGLPTQTLASFAASVAWCQDREVPVIRAFPLMLLRGTGLDQDRARWALVESEGPIPVVIASSSFHEADWRRMAALAANLERGEVARAA